MAVSEVVVITNVTVVIILRQFIKPPLGVLALSGSGEMSNTTCQVFTCIYRYSTRGQVKYWATIQPTTRP